MVKCLITIYLRELYFAYSKFTRKFIVVAKCRNALIVNTPSCYNFTTDLNMRIHDFAK